jgi:hypothetical protein
MVEWGKRSTWTVAPAAAGSFPMLDDYSPYQQKVIRRYYSNQDTVQRQRLAELVTELFLAADGKRPRVWKTAVTAMQKLGVPQSRIEHIVKQNDPALLAQVVKELDGK